MTIITKKNRRQIQNAKKKAIFAKKKKQPKIKSLPKKQNDELKVSLTLPNLQMFPSKATKILTELIFKHNELVEKVRAINTDRFKIIRLEDGKEFMTTRYAKTVRGQEQVFVGENWPGWHIIGHSCKFK